jgi:putative transposase
MHEAEEDVFWRSWRFHENTVRLIKEIKRRALVVGIFPNDCSIIRPVGALVVEQTDEWQVTRHYMSAESLS